MQQKKQYKTLLFDLDHTLWDFETNSEVTLTTLFDKYEMGKQVRSFNKFLKVFQRENAYLWGRYREGAITKDQVVAQRFVRLLRGVGADTSLATAMSTEYLALLPQESKLFPHAIEVLDYLQPSYNLVLVTNGFRKTQERKLHYSGLARFFKQIITSEEAGCLKPNPEIFKHALHKSQSQAHEALMIGDSLEADIVGAKRAGIDQVWFAPQRDIARGRATYKITQLNQLKTIVRL